MFLTEVAEKSKHPFYAQ